MAKGHRSSLITMLMDRDITIASILMDNHQVKGVEFALHDIDTNFAQWASGVLPLLSPDVELVIGLAHLHILFSFAHID